tara:strand:+ start:2246 stop:2440 length:195 start_codon:yes stop_codon:yes gene_type:complete
MFHNFNLLISNQNSKKDKVNGYLGGISSIHTLPFLRQISPVLVSSKYIYRKTPSPVVDVISLYL